MSNAVRHIESSPQYASAVPESVFFVGDSITFGWRDENVGGWANRLARDLTNRYAVTAYNLGVRGDTSRSILARWRDEVERRRREAPSVIVFAFGANDAKLYPGGEPFVPLAEISRNVAAILKAARREHNVLFVGPAPIDEALLAQTINPSGTVPVPTNQQVRVVSSILEEEAARADVSYFDLVHRLADDPGWFESLRETDGLHPPARGHDRIAALVAAWQPWIALFKPSVAT